MSTSTYSVIRGTGSYIPTRRITNEAFLDNDFFDANGKPLAKENAEIIQKFFEITEIEERRYVTDDLVASDIAFFAAKDAIDSSGINPEELDYIMVAHNFGDVKAGSNRTDMVPSLAARVKHKLEIKNPNCIAYDVPFGCPGWLQSMIQADYFIKSGDAKKIMVIGAETLSRVSDPHDRDSMIYADGAGATILEARESDKPTGILCHNTRSDTLIYSKMLFMDKSYHPDLKDKGDIYLKMHGRKLYQYALTNVPQAIKGAIEKCGLGIEDINHILIHQANGKMDDAIIKRLYKLYDKDEVPEHIMPMTISWLGNSSVATVPTLLDLMLNDELKDYEINKKGTLVFASVGAGMNINAMVYQME
ncbi:3-oxoacyl-ACP synthase III family protein [Gracilimonas mengyeensis]|uniref:3-oxoacyl-[acyl-carrier-protein] synthase-3 n=1 Tax=Gracilimonas mengyeensis TaxID=1302730 RepID=A0A521F0H8_9BACT|nr:ketoacyl-ACP synthase III [Gracilimonas mengyeensis]SMO89643.1 3-oxoacyl-[acyl-carrier-protein] synthase-3 [Gracilimonas mengyeensis]